eukprot:gene25800-biopygen15063
MFRAVHSAFTSELHHEPGWACSTNCLWAAPPKGGQLPLLVPRSSTSLDRSESDPSKEVLACSARHEHRSARAGTFTFPGFLGGGLLGVRRRRLQGSSRRLVIVADGPTRPPPPPTSRYPPAAVTGRVRAAPPSGRPSVGWSAQVRAAGPARPRTPRGRRAGVAGGGDSPLRHALRGVRPRRPVPLEPRGGYPGGQQVYVVNGWRPPKRPPARLEPAADLPNRAPGIPGSAVSPALTRRRSYGGPGVPQHPFGTVELRSSKRCAEPRPARCEQRLAGETALPVNPVTLWLWNVPRRRHGSQTERRLVPRAAGRAAVQ